MGSKPEGTTLTINGFHDVEDSKLEALQITIRATMLHRHTKTASGKNGY